MFNRIYVLLLFFSTIHGVNFYPAKESLRRVFNHVLHRQPGIYLSFSESMINSFNVDNQIKDLIGLKGGNVYKSFFYPCKGPSLNKGIALEQMQDYCNNLSLKFCSILGGQMNIQIPDIYSYHPLHVLAEFEHDLHYIARFIWSLKNFASICITEDPVSDELKHLVWGEKCKYIARTEFSSFEEFEQACLNCVPSTFSTIIYEDARDINVIAGNLYRRGVNAFIFSMGNLMDLLTQKTSVPKSNVVKLSKMLTRDVKILYTAALLPNNQFEFRKNEYMTTTHVLNSMWYMPHITEAIRDSDHFLNNGAVAVFHSRVNNARLKNKGVNEGRSMLKALEHFNFDDDAIIIKITGRYHFKSDSFLRLIENTPEVDGYVALDPRTLLSFSGGFALKAKYFKEMLQMIDWNQMEHQMIDMERKVLEFMRKIELERDAKIVYLEEVDIKSFVNHAFHYEW